MIEFEEKYGNNASSLHSSSQSKLRCNSVTEFTFCNVSNMNNDELSNKDVNPFVFSPSFRPKTGYAGYNCSSPATKAQTKILEMMQNLPESCHELSLKDIVAGDHQDVRCKVELENDLKMGFKSKKATTTKRKHPISRSVSLDTGVFMLKMFIPSSLSTKKSKSSSKMCSNKNSFSNNNRNESSIKNTNTCTQTNTKSRSPESAPSCWMINKPWKLTSKRGCVF